ncbi:hypothetical protein LIER_18571 [Lithospermum erythrorhizon]|uniref:Uncharacterized protein n=1 Tax=Lithospermum erythrorhizon TaxID=34254 RepID=A0AAV3QFG6_LITER
MGQVLRKGRKQQEENKRILFISEGSTKVLKKKEIPKALGPGGLQRWEEEAEGYEATQPATVSYSPSPGQEVGGSVPGSVEQNPIGRHPQHVGSIGGCLGSKHVGGRPSPSEYTGSLEVSRPSSPHPSAGPGPAGLARRESGQQKPSWDATLGAASLTYQPWRTPRQFQVVVVNGRFSI